MSAYGRFLWRLSWLEEDLHHVNGRTEAKARSRRGAPPLPLRSSSPSLVVVQGLCVLKAVPLRLLYLYLIAMGASDHELSASGDLGELKQMTIASQAPDSISDDNASVPIGLLPVELLNIIFGLCSLDDPDSLCSLELVNRRWHHILSTEHVPWQNLYLSDTEFDPVAAHGKTKLWFKRAGTLPVDVDLDTRRRDSLLPMLSYLLPKINRWGKLSFVDRRVLFRFAPLPVPTFERPSPRVDLETMIVTIQPQKDVPTDLTTPLILPHGHKSKKTIDFRDADVGYLQELLVLGVRSLPPPEIVNPFLTVTNLTLMNHSTEVDFPTHQAIPFLSSFPVLQSLRLSNHNDFAMVLDPAYRPDCSDVIPILLPNLQFLAVIGICSSRCILSHLSTPNLSVLHLVHINSSTEYDHPRMDEPGDSDDEANDFSRSPWTDHATGMGLRSLFRNGTPPLRELIMDYADLRTKDFKWLFERLPRLEMFHIVASDMSDNVIRALSMPQMQQPDNEDLDSKTFDDTMELDHQWMLKDSRKVLLPRLTRLKLAKCQKMTGDAVVQMVRSRLQAAARGQAAMFTELALTECSQVSEAHAQQLQALSPSISSLIYIPGFED